MINQSARTLVYPEDFIKRVKKAYPASSNLHLHLDAGSSIAGRYLDDWRLKTFSAQEILDALKDDEHKTSAQKLAELKKEALAAIECQELWAIWCQISEAAAAD